MAIINITTSDDTYYGSSFAPGPNDTSTTLNFGGWGDAYYDYLKFDITNGPPAAQVTTAILNMFVTSPSVNNAVCQVNKVTSDWTGATLTRANHPTDDGTNNGSLQSTTASGWITANMTQLYKDWKNGVFTNFGIKINPTVTSNQNNGVFSSLEGAHMPYLSITFTGTSSGFFRIF